MNSNSLSQTIIGSCIEVHKELGPGLLESTYEQCLAHELNLRGINFRLQQSMPVNYKGIKLDCGYRIDLVVEETIILELKSVQSINDVHKAQLLTYMKLSGMKIGLLINFNVTKLVNGIKRFVL